MAVEFSEKTKEKFKVVLGKYPEKDAALLPALWLAQKEFSVITPEVEEYVSKLLGVPLVRVREVLTFYTMYTAKSLGKYHLQLCTNIACTLLGAEDILGRIKNKLQIDVGETTPDKKFTLSTVECLGYCGTAPVIQVNDDFYENLTPKKVDELLGKLK
ncbi:MAG TPA: NADH-quinone oxidoreductase subunit NuoE family protein [Candidatus Hypogeohydataceae bacterium YC41]